MRRGTILQRQSFDRRFQYERQYLNGLVGAQGGFAVVGGNQIYIPKVDSGWTISL